MFRFFKRYALKKALKKYIVILYPYLIRHYGVRDQYSVMQIKASIKNLALNLHYLPYAVALYRYEASKYTQQLLSLDQLTLNGYRQKIARLAFDGDVNYRLEHIAALVKNSGWRGGPAPNWIENKQGRTSL